jgi:hypothetical protein
MAGLAGCAFEVKFDAVPWSITSLLKVAIWGLSTLQTKLHSYWMTLSSSMMELPCKLLPSGSFHTEELNRCS